MGKQTVLIIEDDQSIIDIISEGIKELGNGTEILVANNGLEGLERIQLQKIDLVLLDIVMPVMDGAQLLTELHNRKIWLPIIIISAHSLKNIETKLLDFGIVDHLKKPLNVGDLKSKIREVLKNRDLTDSISGMSLAAILQVLEMEQRTGVISIKTADRQGRIFFRKGRVVDIDAEGLSPTEALGDLLDQSNQDKQINIEYLGHRRKERINKSLTEILLDASRFLDEGKHGSDQLSILEEAVEQMPENEEKKENPKFKELIDGVQDDLGEALLSSQIWSFEGEVLAGYEPQPEVCDLFTQITVYLNEALTTAEFPELGKYYILNLEGKKIAVIIPQLEYMWGMLIDSKRTPLGFLLKVILPGLIDSFEEATAS